MPSGREKIRLQGTLRSSAPAVPRPSVPVSASVSGMRWTRHAAQLRGDGEASIGEPDPVVALDCFEGSEEAVVPDRRRSSSRPTTPGRGRRVVGNHGDGPSEPPPLAAGKESAECGERPEEQDSDSDDEKDHVM